MCARPLVSVSELSAFLLSRRSSSFFVPYPLTHQKAIVIKSSLIQSARHMWQKQQARDGARWDVLCSAHGEAVVNAAREWEIQAVCKLPSRFLASGSSTLPHTCLTDSLVINNFEYNSFCCSAHNMVNSSALFLRGIIVYGHIKHIGHESGRESKSQPYFFDFLKCDWKFDSGKYVIITLVQQTFVWPSKLIKCFFSNYSVILCYSKVLSFNIF